MNDANRLDGLLLIAGMGKSAPEREFARCP
jgi:hypothetical protein